MKETPTSESVIPLPRNGLPQTANNGLSIMVGAPANGNGANGTGHVNGNGNGASNGNGHYQAGSNGHAAVVEPVEREREIDDEIDEDEDDEADDAGRARDEEMELTEPESTDSIIAAAAATAAPAAPQMSRADFLAATRADAIAKRLELVASMAEAKIATLPPVPAAYQKPKNGASNGNGNGYHGAAGNGNGNGHASVAGSANREKEIDEEIDENEDDADRDRDETGDPAVMVAPQLSRAESFAASRADAIAKRMEMVAGIAEAKANALPPVPPEYQKPKTNKRVVKGVKRWTALFCIVIPTLISSIYYFGIATDQYTTSADFVIGTQSAGGTKGGSALTNGGSSVLEVYVVRDYVNSTQMLKDIQPYLDLRKIYSNPAADKWARLDPHVSDEELLVYWNNMVSVNYDMLTDICTLRVRAFTRQDTKDIADRILLLSETLVNRLSDRARVDAVKRAKDEVDLAYARATKARDAMQAFSEATQQISPAALIQNSASIQSSLQSDLVTSESQLALLRKSLPEEAPGVKQMKDHILIVQNQLAQEKAQSTAPQDGKSPSEVANTYAKLSTDNDFASQAYISALSYLENVQVQSVGQESYLEIFVPPALPQISTYPVRTNAVMLTVAVGVLAWTILSLLITASREHAP